MKQGFSAKIIKIVGGIAFVCMVGLSFYLVGSPGKNRELRIDQQRLENVYLTSGAIRAFYRYQDNLPESLENLYEDGEKYPGYYGNSRRFKSRHDALIEASEGEFFDLTYTVVDKRNYTLCTTLSYPSTDRDAYRNYWERDDRKQWQHPAGRHCFEFRATVK